MQVRLGLKRDHRTADGGEGGFGVGELVGGSERGGGVGVDEAGRLAEDSVCVPDNPGCVISGGG